MNTRFSVILNFVGLFVFFGVGMVEAQTSEVTERKVSMKPTNGLGKRTLLIRDDVTIGQRTYYDNGQLFEEERYMKGGRVLHGEKTTWHRNGKRWQVLNYSKGVLDGTCTSWDEEGRELASCEIRNGTGVLQEFHGNGKLISEKTYLKGKKHGNHRMWYDDGSLFADIQYVNDEFEGWARSYHSNGQIRSEVTYSKGKRHGVRYYWNEAGELANHFDPSRKADNKEVTPHYYVKGEKVSLEEYQNAAVNDPTLRKIEER